ncbi:MAG: hypothetical protein AABZ55_07610 [Bdellovibrionota bacterium]
MNRVRGIFACLICTLPLLAFFFAYSGCGGTSTGNGIVAVKLSTYNQLVWWQELIPSAHATVNSVTFCFKRIRFKTQSVDSSDPANDPSNIDFAVGAIALSTAGTSLGSVSIPINTYSRVEFDLEDNCGLGYSVSVANSNGTFTTANRITVKFEGSFAMDQSAKALSLGIQNIIGALNSVAVGTTIKADMEAVSGSL